MFKKLHKINRFLGLVMIFYACNTAKRVPEGKALLQQNYISGVKREWKEQLQGQIKQQPNRKVLFGSTKFYLLVYNIFDTTQHKNWLNKRVIRIGEEPVVYDSSSNYISVQNIKQSLFNMGYFDAEVSWKDTLVGKKQNYAKVYYTIVPQQFYTIKKIRYFVEDRLLDSIITRDLPGSYLKTDHIISKSDIDAERGRITGQLRNAGYYYFNKEYIYFELDSNVENKTVNVKVVIENPGVFKRHEVYTINRVIITIENPDYTARRDTAYNLYKNYEFARNGYNISRDVILSKVFIYRDSIFQQRNIDASYEHLNDLNLFKYVNINFVPDTSAWVHTIVHDELKGDYEFFGDTSGKPPGLICYMRMAPTSKYEFILEPQGIYSDQNNSSTQQSYTNFGGALNLMFRNKNILTNGETFQLNASGALAYQSKKDNSNNIFKRSLAYRDIILDAQLKIPKLPFRLKFIDSRNSYSIINTRYSFESFQEFDRNIFSINNRYQTTLFKLLFIDFALLDISYIRSNIKDKEFENRINSNTLSRIQFLPKFIVSIKLNTVYNSKEMVNNTPLYSVRLGLESSGWLLNKFSYLLNAGYDTSLLAYKLFGVPYSQFYRGDIEVRYNFKIDPYKSFATRFYGGAALPYQNSTRTGIPFEKRFFVGGTNDLRGWRIRKIGPGSYYYDDTLDFYKAGDYKLMINGEYRSSFYKTLSYAVFFDAGNVWTFKKESGKPGAEFNVLNFYRQIALDAGLGLRLDFSFFVVRLDAAVPVYDPRISAKYVPDHWVIKELNSYAGFAKQLTLNLAIGLPF